MNANDVCPGSEEAVLKTVEQKCFVGANPMHVAKYGEVSIMVIRWFVELFIRVRFSYLTPYTLFSQVWLRQLSAKQ